MTDQSNTEGDDTIVQPAVGSGDPIRRVAPPSQPPPVVTPPAPVRPAGSSFDDTTRPRPTGDDAEKSGANASGSASTGTDSTGSDSTSAADEAGDTTAKRPTASRGAAASETGGTGGTGSSGVTGGAAASGSNGSTSPAGGAGATSPVRRGPSSKASARAAAAAGGAAGLGAGAAVASTVAGKAPGLSTAEVLGEKAPAQPTTPGRPTKPTTPGTSATPGTPGTAGKLTISESVPPEALPEVVAAGAAGAAGGAAAGAVTPGSADTIDLAGTGEASTPAGDVAARVKRAVGNPTSHRTRKARLRLAKFDPWSVMKTTFLFSIAFMIAGLAASMLLYGVISSSGVFEAIDNIVGQVITAPGDTTPFRIGDYLTAQRVAGFTLVVGVLNVVLMTAIGTLAAFLYNLAASLLGGLEVTLAED